MSRVPLDSWSKREQLCLASAVSCSGDQNWITVSRTLKAVCGNGNTSRPADWYSQKNCAVQYGHLLETVETTKRKKRTNESSVAGFSSPATVAVETPTELLLRRLTEERMTEIKTQMRRDQELYCKLQREIEALQSDTMSEKQLQSMWQEIEKEQETKRIDEMKMENRMREREQRKKDSHGHWRNNNATAGSATGRRSNLTADTTSVDMEVEDISASTGNNNSKQTAAPAPLLTSLLKSPGGSNSGSSSGNNATSPTTSPVVTPGTGSTARTTAPTITSLLTSGASAMPNQPAIIMKSPNDTAFMTRPITGPPVGEVVTTGRSPSQAAPTLSMLLEKNKLAAAAAAATSKASEATKNADSEVAPNQNPAEAEGVPAENTEAGNESDAEEEQLMEIFKNMDDIMDDIGIEIDSVIDEDILKDVNNVDSPAPAKAEAVDFEGKLDSLKSEENENRKSNKSPAQSKPVEVVVGSSDDSNDNIPLAAVASQESKERNLSISESSNGATANHEAVVDELSETITIASSSSEENAKESTPDPVEETIETDEAAGGKAAAGSSETSTVEPIKELTESDEAHDIDAASVEQSETTEEAPKDEASKSHTVDLDKSATGSNVQSKTPAATTAILVADTDEESSSLTDSSKQDELTRTHSKVKPHAEDKPEADGTAATRQTPPINSSTTSTPAAPGPAPVSARAPLLRKLPHRDRSESPMVDDDATTHSDHSTARSSTRRRCSSTPVIDSIPNSPASSEHTDDRRETRAASKKLFLSIYSTLLESKYASPFRRPFHDEHPHKQADLCLRPMDLPTIKRNIDSGHTRSIHELHRDVLLMCQNLLLIYKPQSMQHKTARHFMQECQAIKDFTALPHVPESGNNSSSISTGSGKIEKEKERTPAGNKVRSGSRKSQRHH